MEKNKSIIAVRGMHCRSCEILIEDNLSQIKGVKRVVVNHKKGIAELHYEGAQLDMDAVKQAVEAAGYHIGQGGDAREQKPLLSKKPKDYQDLGIAFLFLIAIAIILNNLGLTNFSVGSASNPSSLSIVLLVGLTAGISTCMALVGGLILGISARHAELHLQATPMQKFRPHLFFNLGRIGGYAFLGGVLGAIGSAFQLSGSLVGILTILVGVVMLVLGVKLTGIFPRMENAGFALPKEIGRLLGIGNVASKEYSHRAAMVTGALTFFLPCGFTQAMQLYAVSAGSFSRGALIMGVFALGTAPGLLGVGGLTSVIKGAFAQRFFKFAGLVVMFLALFNISNGYTLTGWQMAAAPKSGQSVTSANDSNVKMENGVQVVSMTEKSSGYAPNKFTIKKGIPVRWEIDAQDPYSCASSLVLNKMGIRKSLTAGKNVIEFTPTETGTLPFSCAMGMYTGSFTVVDDGGSGAATTDRSDASTDAASPSQAGAGTCGGSGSTAGSARGGCGGGSRATAQTEGVTQAELANNGKGDAVQQVINATYTYRGDIQPNAFTVQSGQPVKFIIDAKENGSGCMGSVTVPGLTDAVYQLEAGEKIEFDFTPTKPGTYKITCGMGVPRGTITVK